MRSTRWIGVPLCAATLVVLAAGPATARNHTPGEPQGKVEQGPQHANSICSFSGLNDNPDDPDEGGRVQSYGQIVRAGHKAHVPSPSLLCNGHLFPYPEAFQHAP